MATQQQPKTPRAAVLAGSTGGSAALLAAAAVSFQGLAGLGALVGITHPWLLPIAIDIYAATSTVVALLLPPAHPARATAVWNARLGLAMSMAGNAADRAMHLGSFTPSDGFLTFVGSWPSLIVERLLHLQGRLATDATATQDATVTRQVPARRDVAPRPAVAPLPGAPVARPATTATTATNPVTPATTDATATAQPSRTETATPTPPRLPDPAERDERDRKILALIARHGRPDKTRGIKGVTGPMVGEALGVHRANGTRALTSVLERIDRGELAIPEPDDEPERALAVAR